MATERYVVLGLAHARSDWFGEVSRWSTTGSLPIEFIKCVSADELRARLASGRAFSAALLDARLPAVDRDLLAALQDAEVAGIVIGSGAENRDWQAIGAAAHLDSTFGRPELLDGLASHGRLIGEVHDLAPDMSGFRTPAGASWRCPLVAVTGRSGSGVSTIAAAIAQHLASATRFADDVLLLDAARRAHQAVLHDARDVVPGIQELIEAHRAGRPTVSEVHSLTFDVPARGYRLALGLRNPRDWVSVRPQAFRAAIDSVRRAHRAVVADTDPEIEGEPETGSPDIEDRHAFGRIISAAADVVAVVANPSITGIHGLVQQLGELRAHGITGEQLLVVINRAPRAARARSELTRVVASLTGAAELPDPHIGPVFVPERRGIDSIHRDLVPFPKSVSDPPGRAVLETLDRLEASGHIFGEQGSEEDPEQPIPIIPGTLGFWSED